MRKKLIDRSKCVGCKNCELACITIHCDGKNPFDPNLDESIARARNKVELDNDGLLFPEFCRHCDEPACVEACMSGALTKGDDGLVVCNHDYCIGCFMCVMSCPYGMARPSVKNGGKMIKCDGCRGRKSMACVDACPQRCLTEIETDDRTGGQIIYK
ncbi:MAG: 4Fe-4S dicluster domain-containing protein [Victivallales bacterium]